MRILVTGCDGYLGSLLAAQLLERSYEVVGLDTGFYKERMLYRNGAKTPLTLVRDLRRLEAKDLEGFAAVVHMAELSNDPLGQLAPTATPAPKASSPENPENPEKATSPLAMTRAFRSRRQKATNFVY
jgi:nucleoside-diphosphate-sugar epimerase